MFGFTQAAAPVWHPRGALCTVAYSQGGPEWLGEVLEEIRKRPLILPPKQGFYHCFYLMTCLRRKLHLTFARLFFLSLKACGVHFELLAARVAAFGYAGKRLPKSLGVRFQWMLAKPAERLPVAWGLATPSKHIRQ